MIDLALWLLLIVGLLCSLAAAKYTARLRIRLHEFYGPAALVIFGLSGICLVGLWVWVAVLTDYWQLGALSVGGFLIGWAASDEEIR